MVAYGLTSLSELLSLFFKDVELIYDAFRVGFRLVWEGLLVVAAVESLKLFASTWEDSCNMVTFCLGAATGTASAAASPFIIAVFEFLDVLIS